MKAQTSSAHIGAPNSETGQLSKMSKSLNNAILLSDDADTVRSKVMSMYTDPKRLTGKEPGEVDPAKNPLWAFLETFQPDIAWLNEQRDLYSTGRVGDVALKRKLVELLNDLLEPIRAQRKQYEKRPGDVIEALRQGTRRANEVAEQTMSLVRRAVKQDYFERTLTIP